jgi:hypothetical protein
VALIGPTGQGKTTMMRHLLPRHPFVTIVATKPADRTLEPFMSDGYRRIERWISTDARMIPRRILWPDASRLDSCHHTTEVFSDAFDRLYRERAWTVASMRHGSWRTNSGYAARLRPCLRRAVH